MVSANSLRATEVKEQRASWTLSPQGTELIQQEMGTLENIVLSEVSRHDRRGLCDPTRVRTRRRAW